MRTTTIHYKPPTTEFERDHRYFKKALKKEFGDDEEGINQVCAPLQKAEQHYLHLFSTNKKFEEREKIFYQEVQQPFQSLASVNDYMAWTLLTWCNPKDLEVRGRLFRMPLEQVRILQLYRFFPKVWIEQNGIEHFYSLLSSGRYNALGLDLYNLLYKFGVANWKENGEKWDIKGLAKAIDDDLSCHILESEIQEPSKKKKKTK